MLPNFIIFGAIKSGTGALYQYLSHHPQVYISENKEPRYFSYNPDAPRKINKSKNNLQIKSLNEYEKLFSGVKSEIAIGEASSNYINSAFAAARIKELIPHVKLIATLRNPIDRAYAHYLMSNKKGQLDVRVINSMKNEGWATTSLYYKKLKIYFDLFPKEQIKILIFEDWAENVEATLAGLYKYLGVDEAFTIDKHIKYTPAKVNWSGISQASILRKIRRRMPEKVIMLINYLKNHYAPVQSESPLSPEVRKIMADWYREDIVQLESLIGRNLDIWFERTSSLVT